MSSRFKRTGAGPKGMKYKTLTYMALRNLIFKRLRTTLTATGVVIGIGAIVFLVSLAFGLRNTVNHQIIGSESVKTIDVTSPDATTIHINDEALAKFSNFSHVNEVAKSYIVAAKIAFDNSSTDTVTYGVDSRYLKLVSPKVVSGSINLGSGQTGAVVNLSLLKTIGIDNSQEALGKSIVITADLSQAGQLAEPFPSVTEPITGVIATGSGSELYTSYSFLQKAGLKDYAQAKVVVDGENSVSAIRQQIEGLGFVTQSPVDTIDQINHLFRIFALILAGFGGVGMIIAILGMFNTLTISLLERTSEIGLMMSIGARRRDVKRLFTIEALIMSLSGGLGGIIGAWTLGSAINLILSNTARHRGLSGGIELFSIPWFIAGLATMFVLAVGYLVVLLPSRRAARINPIDALRHE